MSIAKNTKETYLEEIIDNLTGNTRDLPVDCQPRTREEVLLAAIEKNTRNRTGGGGTGGGPSNPSEYLHKVNDKASFEDISQGDLDDGYVTPKIIIDYLTNLLSNSGINVLSVNGKTGAILITREDMGLDNVINVKQAAEVDFNNHIADYNNAHITSQEKTNIYNKIAEAGQIHLAALPKAAKASVDDTLEGVNDELYVTSKGLLALLQNEIGEIGTIQEVSVATVNGKSGNVLITREDVELENVINEKQATKVEFDAHLKETENYHVTPQWRNSVLSRLEALERKLGTSVTKDMKATTDLALEGEDDTTYMTPFGIKKLVDKIVSENGTVTRPTIGDLNIGDTYIDPTMIYNNSPIEWIVVDKSRYNKDEVTLLSKNILSIKSFDGKEPTNKNGNRAAYGNNNYVLSNIHQWLNARGSNWYEPTHQYDAAPSNDNVLNSHNDYDNEPGFLTQFYDSAIGYMVSVDNMFEADTADGDEVLSFTSKVYLASDSEMGFVDDTNEGFKFRIFRELDFDKRAYPTDKCVEQCEYTDAALNVSKNYSYWLRSIGTNKNNTDVSFISANGNMSYVGARNSKTGIRPVINVKSTMPIELSGVNVNNDLISKEIDNDGTR